MSESASEPEQEVSAARYWLRVQGYPDQIGEELVSYGDFYDSSVGPLRGDPKQHLRRGDIVFYYADGPASLYAAGVVDGDVDGPFEDGPRGERWRVSVKPEAVISAMSKAAHAGALVPPSGWHFLRVVRQYTFIRLPDVDGPYLMEQVKSRVSAKGE